MVELVYLLFTRMLGESRAPLSNYDHPLLVVVIKQVLRALILTDS